MCEETTSDKALFSEIMLGSAFQVGFVFWSYQICMLER